MFCARFISSSSDFMPFFISGTLHVRLLLEISIHTADAAYSRHVMSRLCAHGHGYKPFRASLIKMWHVLFVNGGTVVYVVVRV